MFFLQSDSNPKLNGYTITLDPYCSGLADLPLQCHVSTQSVCVARKTVHVALNHARCAGKLTRPSVFAVNHLRAPPSHMDTLTLSPSHSRQSRATHTNRNRSEN